MNASIRDGFAELGLEGRECVRVQLDDAIVRGDVDNATAELVSELSQGLKVLVFMSQCLGGGKNPWVEGSILDPGALQFSSIHNCHTS